MGTDDFKRFTVSGFVPFDIQVQARDQAAAQKAWHDALAALANPALPIQPGLEMAFFTDQAAAGDLMVDDVTEDLNAAGYGEGE